MGKGDTQRKRQVSFDKYSEEWNRVFNKKKQDEIPRCSKCNVRFDELCYCEKAHNE